jgi:hypothetical protein
MSNKIIYVVGGGTMSHVANHLSLVAPAYGATAREIVEELREQIHPAGYRVQLVLTRLADPASKIVTNEDLEAWLDEVVADPATKAIVFNCAVVDFEFPGGDAHGERFETSKGDVPLRLTPSRKLIGKIRRERKDIFVVGFKTTTGADRDEQYAKGLRLLKQNSLNLVVANDVLTRRNMIIVPEEAHYMDGQPRELVLSVLVRMMLSRMQGTFTRSTVVEGPPVGWESTEIPFALRDVVDYCITHGAYKPVLGKTVGHFAARGSVAGNFITTARKTDFNLLKDEGMLRMEARGRDEVLAQGRKPSVGGQSQRIVFDEHPDVDCIVHFHCPLKAGSRAGIPVRSQWPHECGSHECGQNTSSGLRRFDLGDGQWVKAVYLDHHGPNLAFSKDAVPYRIETFIEENFDLAAKTGGTVALP